MQRNRKLALTALVLLGLTIPLASAAEAAPGPRGHFAGRGLGSGPRGWTGGSWVHGWHGARFGWWWSVGPSWYWYSSPVYPYPAYYGYPPVDDGPTVRGYYPPPKQAPAPQQFWYYCNNPRGYYPYVEDCAEWRQVPAAPPPTEAPPPYDSPEEFPPPDDGPSGSGPRQLQPRQ